MPDEKRPPQGVRNVELKREFSRRLRHHLLQRQLNQSELARRAGPYMPGGSLSRDLISKYVKGTTLPGPVVLQAISKALDVDPSDLMPDESFRPVGEITPPLEVKITTDGDMWLRVNQRVPYDVGLQILALLKKEAA